ncbi:MAG: hypothetical protein ACQERF_12100, partial [Actinomycetota bacterium]
IDAQLPVLRAAAGRVVSTKGDAFRAVITGQTVATRADAAEVLRAWGRTHQVRIGSWRSPSQDLPLGHFASIGGLEVEATISPRPAWDTPSDVMLRLEDVPGMPPMVVSLGDLLGGESCRGLVTRLEHYVASVEKQIARLETQRGELEVERGDAELRLGEPFKHTAALHAAQERLRSVDARMARAATEKNPAAETTTRDGESVPAGVAGALRAAGVGEVGYRAARRTTINAHNTDPGHKAWAAA